MKIAIAGFHIESVSFLPNTVHYADFEEGVLRGAKVVTGLTDTNTVIGGFLEICQARGATTVPLVYAYLGALGRVADDVVERYTAEICKGLADIDDLDGVLLHLHGAAWAPGYEDPERFIIESVRRTVGERVRIMVGFDYHGNLDADSIRACDAAFAYQKSPHTDMGETGRRTANCMTLTLQGKLSPTCRLVKPGVLTPSIFSATQLNPLAKILAEARRLEHESDSYLDISIMAGFSYADATNTGFSVMTVTDANAERANTIATSLCERIWQDRHELYRPEHIYSLDEAVNHALETAPRVSKPIVLLEHADRMSDSTYLLDALIRRNAQRTAVPFLWDPQAAEMAAAAGVGATTTLTLGAHSSRRAGPRLTVECEVLQAEPKSYYISGAMLQGSYVNLGLSALLRIGDILVSVISRPAFGVDEDAFTVFDQNPRDYDIIVLRSKTHFRQVYQDLAEEILIVDTPDYGPADLTTLPYERLDTRSVYPFVEHPTISVKTEN
ncbi:M81 family metallopeptidase [Vreelandella zhaodongensis]|uniref:M81 family metallopeptidase n=1 Tax=Vreelandella zhaodongensis TaxID=1176240 RepID=A0ABX2SYI9_VREZH|nr:M81 family metallopeptidase [Halomonas zhaodongensis]NYS46374.1 M81 family metallopeptidase [Halomonas zhaodongensis]